MTVITTESPVHDGEVTPRVEAKELEKEEGAGGTGFQTTRGMNGHNRASNALGVEAVRSCRVSVGRGYSS